eukprot:scaffold282266_cov22-Prasinocladus_malaysianus.AAC.1
MTRQLTVLTLAVELSSVRFALLYSFTEQLLVPFCACLELRVAVGQTHSCHHAIFVQVSVKLLSTAHDSAILKYMEGLHGLGPGLKRRDAVSNDRYHVPARVRPAHGGNYLAVRCTNGIEAASSGTASTNVAPASTTSGMYQRAYVVVELLQQ